MGLIVSKYRDWLKWSQRSATKACKRRETVESATNYNSSNIFIDHATIIHLNHSNTNDGKGDSQGESPLQLFQLVIQLDKCMMVIL